MSAKRCFDLFFALPGLILLSPLFLLVAVLIRRNDHGPVFFRQVRVGLNGNLFRIFKFRTMYVDAEKRGTQITPGNDPRITPIGQFLRKCKIDELPQLINVVVGEMSLVGPRPEVQKYMDFYPADVRTKILSVLPGITDFASIEFRNEGEILERSSDPEKTYVLEIMPIKARYYLKYIQERNLFLDLRLILRTIASIFIR
ncbi:MAG: sugar transferase [Candidatus Ozemobacteraceae bacterium]